MATKPNFEQIAAAQKANTEVLMAMMRSSFEGMQRVADLNMTATRELFDTTLNNANTLMAAKDINEAAKLNEKLAKPSVDQLMDYNRRLYELMAEVQKEMTGIVQSQYSQFAKTAAGAIDETKASAPVGGDVFAAAMQSMLNATNQVFDQMNAATRQLTDIAEANMQNTGKAATKATSKAVASSRAKK